METLYDKIADTRKGSKKAALCIVVSTKGSTPRKAGSKMIVYENGEVTGSIGGGDLEKKVIENALEQIKKKEATLFRHDLLHEHNMCCGGTVNIYIEPIMPAKKLYIFGAGHTGKALAGYAKNFDFEVFIIDERDEYMQAITDKAINKMKLHYQEALPLLPFDENTFVVIATYSHPFDRDILAYCLKKPHAYLGMIGSQRKIALTRKMFTEGGIATEEELAATDMPIGIDIKAETPGEIAVSILAKMIEVKNTVIIDK